MNRWERKRESGEEDEEKGIRIDRRVLVILKGFESPLFFSAIIN